MNFPRIPMLNHTRAYLLQDVGMREVVRGITERSGYRSARKGWTVEITLS